MLLSEGFCDGGGEMEVGLSEEQPRHVGASGVSAKPECWLELVQMDESKWRERGKGTGGCGCSW